MSLNITQEELVTFAHIIFEKNEEKADINENIKELIEDFMEEKGIEKKDKKFLNVAIKEFGKFLKNRDQFNEAERIKNEFLDILTGEKCITRTDGTQVEI